MVANKEKTVPADIVLINVGESEFHVWLLLICMKSVIKKNIIKSCFYSSEQKFHTVIGAYI